MKRRIVCLAGLLVLVVVAVAACANTFEMSIGADCERGFCDEQPVFTAKEDAGPDALPPESQLLACIGTECPAPYATCGDHPSALCATNLLNDSEHCGACGVSCGGEGLERLRMRSRCSGGACELECIFDPDIPALFRDCNNAVDDGCEVDIFSDPDNCGACGNTCPPGVRCIQGMCGCPTGQLDCNGKCIHPSTDDANCKSCGNACTTPDVVCDPMPPNTKYGCRGGQCGQLKCMGGFGDCNGDIAVDGCASDGCETHLLDPNHCGACGVKCGPQQECALNANNQPACRDRCTDLGLLQCGKGGCIDPINDPNNCGGCGINCNRRRPNELPVCSGGVCTSECAPGFADCNGDPTDGCEVDLRSHPAHCGACSNSCDQLGGQPCIEGKCLMVECDGGVYAK